MKKGLEVFGDDGVAAVRKELQQLHDRKVGMPELWGALSREEKSKALNYLMFLKRKRCGRIKGRGCADGRKQRVYTSKEDARSPTVAVESLFLSLVLDALEEREVAIVDIPGAFMQTAMGDETVHVRLTGKMVEILMEIAPDVYEKCVGYEKGEPVIYMRLLKALYGTVRAARLFWQMLSSSLVEWGFEINPYDECVANKMINGKQCTIVWHVDDLKISHADPEVVDSVIEMIDERFGKEDPITRNRGKVHDYLGMKIDFSEKGKVKIIMQDYIEAVLEDAPEELLKGSAATPAAEHLFKDDPGESSLDEEKAEYFHSTVARLLFLTLRGRPDIAVAIAYLCTKVKSPNFHDYNKLGRVLKYLRETIDLPLTLEATKGSLLSAQWWVDASYAPHDNMRSHTGATFSLGKGGIFNLSTIQKLVARSSTEAELIGVHDVLPLIIWTKYFLEAQGYKLKYNKVYQDNMSAMLLEKNGRGSSGKKTRHINLRYFFAKDRIDAKEISVEYCPTEDMWGDFFTKPLQGGTFKRMRQQIMNIDPQSKYAYVDHRSVLEQDHDSNDINADTTEANDGQANVSSATEYEVAGHAAM